MTANGRLIITAAIVYAFLRGVVVSNFRIPSNSMEPVLTQGDFILVEKVSMGVQFLGAGIRAHAIRPLRRGDIVVFEAIDDPEIAMIKRIVGIPGDTLAMRRGALFRNERREVEPYARQTADHVSDQTDFLWQRPYVLGTADERAEYVASATDWGPLVIPKDSYFVLGDNRGSSYDSRETGFVSAQRIRGRALLIYFSINPDLAQGSIVRRIRSTRIGRRL